MFLFIVRSCLHALPVSPARRWRPSFGNFEAGGQPLPSRVRFVVTRVVHEHVIDRPASNVEGELTYRVFGSREHAFAVHRVAGSPQAFDEVLRVDLGGEAPSNAELSNGVEVRIPGVPDRSSARLGLGTAPVLAKADAAGLPCYLETMKTRNVPFYRKHGFEVIVEDDLPGGGFHFWTMRRDPR